MKKVLAIVLALCMVFAMSTAAFAATGVIRKDGAVITPEQAQTVIKTVGTSADDEYYVTIPADITIAWNDMGEKTLTASVRAYLAAGSSVDVSVAVPTEMVCTDPSINYALPLQVSAASDGPIHAVQDGPNGLTWTMDTIVHVGNFVAPVAEYVANAVYTVTYTPGA